MLLRSNTFTSSGGYLLAPYNTVYKFAAIVLDDVERVVIGDSSLDGSVSANVFENSNYGIYANNTGFEVYNCTFSSISPLDQSLALNKYYGSCIYSKSSSDYNDRHAIVGNKDYSLSYPATSKQNHFYSSYQGIVSLGEMNLKVFNNEFGDPDVASEGPSVFSVLTGNSSIKQVYIARENTFNNFNVGVRAFGLNYQGLYHIGDNYFEKAKPNIPSNPTAYQGTAIWVGNSLRLPGVAETPYLKIFNNRIGNPETNTQARIGIFVSSIVDPLIEYNDIYYQVDAVPSYPAVGIWTQNCMNPKVVDNDILNTESYASHSNLMTGIRSDMNTQGCFSRNHLNYLGNSFHFMGPHGQVGFAENEMNYYDNAIFINNAEIGVQGFADINNSIYRTDDNKFYHDLLSQPERVIGSAINNLPISWYYNNSDNQLYNPDINGNIPTSLLFEIGLTPNLDPIECPEIINPIARNMAYGFIVRDTARYDETYAQYFSYHAKRGMYNILKRNPQLLDMDDSTDVFYNTFFDEMQLSNLAKFDSVYQFTEAGEIASAHAILNSIEDTNAIEEYCKAAFGIGINKLNLDSALSNADSSAFYEIADMHALTTGEAAFISRNMLFYEIHDGVLGGGSRLAQIRKPQKTTFKVELYPVPVKDLVYFIYENGIPDVVEIYDVQHRCILKTGNVHRIELSLLSPGSYIVRFLQDNDVLTTKKLIKVQ